jgi:integrase/recombinase XerD
VTIQPVSQPVSPLRQRMLEDMAMRGLRQDTQHDYVRYVRSFAAFLKRPPDTTTPEDVRRFQVHQAESGVQPQSINCSVSALRFFFTVTLDRPDLARRFVIVRYPQKLPTVLSTEEVGRLLEMAPGPKYRAALGTAYGAGLRVSEVATLKVGDIDSTRMLIRVEQGKGRKDRNAMLSPQLLELLRLWWREGKRRGVMLPQGWLFPGRNSLEPISTRQLHRAVHEAAEAAGIKKRVSPHTHCATPLPPTCSSRMSIFVSSRFCSGMPTSRAACATIWSEPSGGGSFSFSATAGGEEIQPSHFASVRWHRLDGWRAPRRSG